MPAIGIARASAEAAIYRGFACPYESLDRQFLETVAVEYARGFAQRFARRCRQSRGIRSRALMQFIDRGLEKRLTFETVWNSSFSQTRRALLETNSSGLKHRAAALGLRLAEAGHLGEWDIELDSSIRLQFDRWLLPSAKWIKVISGLSEITIHVAHLGHDRVVKFSRRRNRWETDGAEALPGVNSSDGRRWLLLPGAAAKSFPLDGIRPIASADADTAISAIQPALDLLTRYAPIYLPWVSRVLREIIAVQSVPGKICSGSFQDHPGTIYLSVDCPPVAIAEMLVHEASHQYYYLLARYGVLDTGADETFFSPIKGTKRPLSMILLAYHAFANVLLFYRLCRKYRLQDADYCRENETQLVPQLHVLEDALAGAKALTLLGESLWRPLAARLW